MTSIRRFNIAPYACVLKARVESDWSSMDLEFDRYYVSIDVFLCGFDSSTSTGLLSRNWSQGGVVGKIEDDSRAVARFIYVYNV